MALCRREEKMSTERRTEIVMNLMYNLLLAVILSIIAEEINAGGVQWPGIIFDTIVSYILEMVIVLWFPFKKWGFAAAKKKAELGSSKFRWIMSIVTAIPFATLMCACMSFVGIKAAGAPLFAWGPAFLRVWPLFIVVAALCARFLIPPFTALAKKLIGAPEQENH